MKTDQEHRTLTHLTLEDHRAYRDRILARLDHTTTAPDYAVMFERLAQVYGEQIFQIYDKYADLKHSTKLTNKAKAELKEIGEKIGHAGDLTRIYSRIAHEVKKHEQSKKKQKQPQTAPTFTPAQLKHIYNLAVVDRANQYKLKPVKHDAGLMAQIDSDIMQAVDHAQKGHGTRSIIDVDPHQLEVLNMALLTLKHKTNFCEIDGAPVEIQALKACLDSLEQLTKQCEQRLLASDRCLTDGYTLGAGTKWQKIQ